jgi:hypothetical protein
MKTPEGYEKDDTAKYLDSIGAWHFRPFMAGYGKSGVADIVACIPITITLDMVGHQFGVFASLEVKREGKEPTALQNIRINDVREAYGFATWGTAARIIRQIKLHLKK